MKYLGIACLLLITGCATTWEKDALISSVVISQKIAQGDVAFASYCDFSLVPENTLSAQIVPAACAVTTKGVHIYRLNGKDVLADASYAEISAAGVASHGKGRQLQLKLSVGLIALSLSTNTMLVDHELTEEVKKYIHSNGVPAFDPETFVLRKANEITIVPLFL